MEMLRNRTPDHAAKWQAIAYVLAGVVAISNAVWFYNWRARAVDHHNELTIARSQKKQPEQVIVYREAQRPRESQRRPALADDEQCTQGQVIRRIPNGWENTGRRC
jgi:precorrin-3B methylase